MKTKLICTLAALGWGVLGPALAWADMLTITRGDSTVVLTHDDFMALPQTGYTTENDYLPGPTAFQGVLLKDLLDLVGGAPGEAYRAVALNDYAITLTYDEAVKYPVLVARLRDGVPMPVRNKGPLWVIYPTAELEPVDLFSVNSKLIWQLARLEYSPDAD